MVGYGVCGLRLSVVWPSRFSVERHATKTLNIQPTGCAELHVEIARFVKRATRSAMARFVYKR